MQPLLSALGEWDQTMARRRFNNGYHQKDACIIVEGSAPVGWMQVTDTPKALVLNQIHLVPEARGQGIGSRLIQDLMVRAAASGRGVTLAVVRNNPARKLYERLGFSVVGEDGSRLRMAWPASSLPLSRSIPVSAP
jgi:ribosomal protein S18 acetylase RimI-like enzyme